MFERFTHSARRVVVFAQEEARLLNHNYIGTEHLLLALLHEGNSRGTHALKAMNISLESARRAVESIVGAGDSPPSGHIPFTSRAKKVLELSLREALVLDDREITPDHILLGLIAEGEGVGAKVLVNSGAALATLRQQLLQGRGGREESDIQGSPACPRCGADLRQSAAYDEFDVEGVDHRLSKRLKVVFCRDCGNTFALSPREDP